MMRKLALVFVAVMAILAAYADDPRLDRYLPKDGVIRKDRVHIAFDAERRTPVWTAYYYDRTNTDRKFSRDGKSFRKDVTVPGSSDPDAYERSGYDRGHMVPANDMEFTELALTETFLTSNIVPQNPKVNRGVWKDIETFVRKLGRDNELVIVTGPVYERGSKRGTLSDGTAVPDAVFKIVHCPREGWTIAFLAPNSGIALIMQSSAPAALEVPWTDVEAMIGVKFEFGVR